VFGNHVSALHYTTMLQRRLRMRVYATEHHCAFCDGVCDVFGDHALVCPGGGDRTLRHHALRNLVYRSCIAAGLCPVLEKPGLLRPRPHIGSVAENGNDPTAPAGSDARRPGDVWLPHWRLGRPAALDFAVTSGLQVGSLVGSAKDGGSPALAYELHKRSFLNTAALCEDVGLDFVPMVVEASGGGWGSDAREVLGCIAKAAATLTGDAASVKAEQLIQSLAVCLHRANASAILRRSVGAAPLSPALASAASTLAAAQAACAHPASAPGDALPPLPASPRAAVTARPLPHTPAALVPPVTAAAATAAPRAALVAACAATPPCPIAVPLDPLAAAPVAPAVAHATPGAHPLPAPSVARPFMHACGPPARLPSPPLPAPSPRAASAPRPALPPEQRGA
jgi:hypothetical protein